MRSHGFTLLELTITMSILSVVGVLAFVAIAGSASSVAVAKAKTDVQDDARNVVQAIARELQLAGKTPDASLTPPLTAIAITANPVAGSPIQITFQTPTDGTALRWSSAITYRFINEDANGNARLDAGEDLDRDGTLTRRVVRIQDGQTRVVAGANHIANVQLARNGNVVTVTVTASALPNNQRRNPIRTTIQQRVYLLN